MATTMQPADYFPDVMNDEEERTAARLAALYTEARKPHHHRDQSGRTVEHRQPAAHAFTEARTRLRWADAGGYEALAWEAERTDLDDDAPTVRLLLKPDQDSDPTDFDGTDEDHEEAAQRASRDGMWGVVAQHWTGGAWEEVDSVWGFIGDDWQGSGYDIDLMRAALDAHAAHLAAAARCMEAARPDLYPMG